MLDKSFRKPCETKTIGARMFKILRCLVVVIVTMSLLWLAWQNGVLIAEFLETDTLAGVPLWASSLAVFAAVLLALEPHLLLLVILAIVGIVVLACHGVLSVFTHGSIPSQPSNHPVPSRHR